MISIAALWLPIVLSGVVVFVVSAMVWMAMPHHKKDFAQVEDEGMLLDAIRGCGAGPGMYVFPLGGRHRAKLRRIQGEDPSGSGGYFARPGR